MQPPKPTRTPLWLFLPLLAGSLSIRPATAAAECIPIPRTTAGELAQHHIAFAGDVTDVNKALAPGLFGIYDVRFNVREPYKGAQTGPRTMRFLGSAEDFQFKEGQRVLVFAYRLTRDQLRGGEIPPEFRPQYAVQCTPTRLAALDDPQLTELRRLTRRRRLE
jgi:hypothetical protein